MSSLDSSSQNVAHSTRGPRDHRKHSDHDWSESHRKDRGTICLPVVKMRVFEPDQQDIFIVCNMRRISYFAPGEECWFVQRMSV